MLEKTTGVPLSFNVNGKKHDQEVDPRHSLLEVLRDDVGLTGAKRGCEDGTCGTCTVIVNGSMVRACRVSVEQTEGSEVVTIEGLASSREMHSLQKAFIAADAVQCGFCTPGMIMAAKALLDRNPTPTREQIVKGLGSNLCRCTGYTSILEAVTSVIESAAGAINFSSPPPQQAVHRNDATDKVLGKTRYAADLTMPDMLHAAVVRSPHPHAEILGIDDREARALPGVVAIVTSEDVPGLNRYGRVLKDQPVLADDRVRQIGDPVAAVAATSPEVAAQAGSLVKVSYRPIPAVLDPQEALRKGAPAVHEDGNLLAEREVSWGDAQAEMSSADLVLDEEYSTTWIEHAYLEPEAALAYLEDDGRLVVRAATQYSFMQRETIAETMGLPLERVRVYPTAVGGAFGGKNDTSHLCIAALLTMKTKRPVKIVYSREESFVASTKRHPFRVNSRIGASNEGRLLALQADMIADTGAYASSGPSIFIRSEASMGSPYLFPSASIDGKVIYTNNPMCGSMRGFGAPQSVFALESQIDTIAGRLGIDPLEFRLMNRRRSDPKDVLPQVVEQEAAYEKTLEAVRPYYEEALRSRNGRSEDHGRLRRGVGIASMRYGVGSAGMLHSAGRVTLELETDGHINLLTGAMDLGQGSDTTMRLIVAKELGVSLDLISVTSGDTANTPDAGTAGGSRLTYYVGNAALDSAIKLKEAALTTGSGLLEKPVDTLELTEGNVASANGVDIGAPKVSLSDVARARSSAGLPLRFDGVFETPSLLHDAPTGEPCPFPVYVSATHMAEVEVDIDTGLVRVLRVVAVHDVGRAIYPLGLKGQIEGSVVMGMGFALKEEFRPGETTGFKQYRIPVIREVPEIVTLLVEIGDPSTGLGAKGAAESALVAVAPAITNAIADATGVRIHHLPATPSRLLAQLTKASDAP